MTNEQKFLRKILYNPFLREKFKDFEENKKYFYYYDKEDYVLKLQDLIISEIENMNCDTFDIELILSWFKNILQDYYFNDIYLLFNSKLNETLIKKAKKLNVEIEPYTTYLSSLFAIEEYANCYEKSINKYLNYANNYMMNEEFERYVFAINSCNNVTEEIYHFIFYMLLDKKYVISEKSYSDFFYKFCVFTINELDLKDIEIVYSNQIKDTAKYKHEKDKNGTIRKYIMFKKNMISSKNIIDNLTTLFHELKHGLQFEEMTHLYELGALKQLQDKVLNQYLGPNFYENNYHIISYEIDATICSQIFLSEFLKKAAPLTYRKEKDELKEKIELLMKKETNTKRMIYNEYSDLQILFSIILKNNPEILTTDLLTDSQKSVLLQVYNMDTTPKTPDCYFKEKEKLLLELQSDSLSNEEKKEINKKIEFYDAVLNTFEYSIENLKRNFIALEKFESTNSIIMDEAIKYKHELIDKLISYGYGSTGTTEKRVIQ